MSDYIDAVNDVIGELARLRAANKELVEALEEILEDLKEHTDPIMISVICRDVLAKHHKGAA